MLSNLLEQHDELNDEELFDRQLEDSLLHVFNDEQGQLEELQDMMLDETHFLLQLEDMQLSLKLSNMLEQHDELKDEELFERQLEDSLLHVFNDEQEQLEE